MTNITKTIKDKVKSKRRGWIFSAQDFTNFGSYDAVRRALARMAEIGQIKRLADGVYYSPRYHEALGELPVEIDAVIDFMQRSQKARCQPSGAYAANLLGLSEQVPAKVTVITDGPTKRFTIGNRQILFKKTVPKNMKNAGTKVGLMIQAIKYIGKDHITPAHMQKLKKCLTKKDINTLKRNDYYAPAWIVKVIRSELLGKPNG